MHAPSESKPLHLRHCTVVEGTSPLGAEEVEKWLGAVEGWRFRDGAIERTFEFSDFHHTMAFVNALAWVAHQEDHHPDLAVSFGRCTVRYNTHSAGGITVNDFICAAKLDVLNATQAR